MFKFFRLAIKNVFRNTQRTVLTVLTVSIGFMSIIVTAGYMDYVFVGLRESFIRGGTGHIQVFTKEYTEKDEQHLLEYGLQDYENLKNDISSDKEVRFVMKRIEFQGLVSNGEQTKVFLGKGVEPKKESKLSTFFVEMEKGTFPGLITNEEGELQGAVGKGLAKDLQAEIGDYLTLLSATPNGMYNAIDIKLSGIFSTGIPEYDNRQVMVDIPTAQLLLNTDKISNLVVVLEETSQTPQTLDKFEKKHASVSFLSWSELTPYYNSVVALYERGFGVLGIIIVFIVVLASSNTMTMSVFERTKEIATILSIGTSRLRVWLNYIYEGFLIGLLSSVIGTVLSYTVIFTINEMNLTMPPPPGRTTAYPLTITPLHTTILIVTLLTIVVCVVATLLPAYRASKLNIVEALGHE